ncbi:hypothetical protein [Psychroserpens sp. NJDZ02]|uniref:hypothetical protein n=1 Tax=Psychroserpens sp. NJDZ02 TaxID=2570561 RepID=UPI0010A804DC|nr:hypothetical protein [Psychroserpens sp. NJDZ02]QCE40399.1 hypothetical protein E9099_02875 [Psychroserpens sp. NJDZ02]
MKIIKPIKTILLLLLNLALLNSCSENESASEEIFPNSDYTTSYKKNENTINTNRVNTTNITKLKYLKIVFKPKANRANFNNIFFSQIQQTLHQTPITIDENTLIYIYDEANQAAIDSLFETSDTGICLLCAYLQDLPNQNNPDYIVVNKICYSESTNENNKNIIRSTYSHLMHIILNGTDCEIWIMRNCCLSQEDDGTGTTNRSPHILSTQKIQ